MKLSVELKTSPYDIIIEKGALNRAGNELNLDRKVMIVTDSGVPKEYAERVALKCKQGIVRTVSMGEGSKELSTYEALLCELLNNDFTRKDCVVSVGGGVVGDLAGFVAASYMRGIDFYNVPTTVLASVDSSIGGKTAVNFQGVKNIIGAFYQPKKVLIDPDVFKTLPKRQISNGLAEAVKMSLTFDGELFAGFEKGVDFNDLSKLIYKSLDIKRKVVEADEKEKGLRKVLNFGHTLGHGIEVSSGEKLLHGESVALGMLRMCSEPVKERLTKVLNMLNLPTEFDFDKEKALNAISHDKKSNGDTISTIFVEEAGKYEIREMTLDELKERL